MKSLDFIFVGNVKNPAYKALEEEYRERIARYVPECRIHVVKDSVEKGVMARKKRETDAILEKIGPKDVVIVCDEFGKALNSVQFSQKLDSWCGLGPRLVFVVGGPYGMTEDIKHKCHFCLKLSEWTLPHELARVVILEQAYRAFTILKGEKYHH